MIQLNPQSLGKAFQLPAPSPLPIHAPVGITRPATVSWEQIADMTVAEVAVWAATVIAPHQAQHFALQEVDGRTLRTATMMEMMIWGVAGGPAKTMVDALQALQAGVARL